MIKQDIPKGWKLVPDGVGSLPYEMFEAGKAEFKRLGGFNPYSIYKAMLAAAPEPPADAEIAGETK
jgi:hypothetical protein